MSQTYRLKLLLTNDHTLSEIFNVATSTNAGDLLSDRRLEIIQSLNIIVGSHPKSSSGTVASIGPNKHYSLDAGADDKWDLGAGLTALRGFFVSVRAGALNNSLLLNVQVKCGAFYQAGSLKDLMRAFLSVRPRDWPGLGRLLKKLSIYVTHLPKKNKAGQLIIRPKAITGLASMNDTQDTNAPKVAEFGAAANQVQIFFESKDEKAGAGRYQTVADYFKKGKLSSREIADRPRFGRWGSAKRWTIC